MSGETDQVKWRGVRPVHGIRGIWPERDAVRVNEEATANGVDTVTIYQVPASKRLFISNLCFSSRMAIDGSAAPRVFINTALGVLQYRIVYHYYDIAGHQMSPCHYVPALEVEPTDKVLLYNNHASCYATGVLHGWLEDD